MIAGARIRHALAWAAYILVWALTTATCVVAFSAAFATLLLLFVFFTGLSLHDPNLVVVAFGWVGTITLAATLAVLFGIVWWQLMKVESFFRDVRQATRRELDDALATRAAAAGAASRP